MATFPIPKRTVPMPPEMLKKASRNDAWAMSIPKAIAILIILTSAVSFLYLSEFNAIASQGVVINDEESARSKLIIENEVWNMRIAKLKSLDVIDHQSVVKKMPDISPTELDFIDLDRKKPTPGAAPEAPKEAKSVPLDLAPAVPEPVDNNIE